MVLFFSCHISILCENNRIAEFIVDILANHIFNIIACILSSMHKNTLIIAKKSVPLKIVIFLKEHFYYTGCPARIYPLI